MWCMKKSSLQNENKIRMRFSQLLRIHSLEGHERLNQEWIYSFAYGTLERSTANKNAGEAG